MRLVAAPMSHDLRHRCALDEEDKQEFEALVEAHAHDTPDKAATPTTSLEQLKAYALGVASVKVSQVDSLKMACRAKADDCEKVRFC